METNCLNSNPQAVKPALTNETFMPKDKNPIGPGDLNPKRVAKNEIARIRIEFGRHLHEMMLDRHLRQSDLARLTGMGRDSISQYVNGNTLPTEENSRKLAKALNVGFDEIYPPNFRREAADTANHGLRLTQVVGEPNKCWLYINRPMTFALAAEIIKLIEGAEKD